MFQLAAPDLWILVFLFCRPCLILRGMDENVGAALDLLLSGGDALDVVVVRRGLRRGLMPGSLRRLCTCWAVSSRRFWMTPAG